MNYGKILAWVLVTLDVCASIGYLCAGDYRRSLYWLFAAGLTTTVTL